MDIVKEETSKKKENNNKKRILCQSYKIWKYWKYKMCIMR